MAYTHCRVCEDKPHDSPTPGDCVVGYVTCPTCESDHPLEDFERRDIINKVIRRLERSDENKIALARALAAAGI